MSLLRDRLELIMTLCTACQDELKMNTPRKTSHHTIGGFSLGTVYSASPAGLEAKSDVESIVLLYLQFSPSIETLQDVGSWQRADSGYFLGSLLIGRTQPTPRLRPSNQTARRPRVCAVAIGAVQCPLPVNRISPLSQAARTGMRQTRPTLHGNLRILMAS